MFSGCGERSKCRYDYKFFAQLVVQGESTGNMGKTYGHAG